MRLEAVSVRRKKKINRTEKRKTINKIIHYNIMLLYIVREHIFIFIFFSAQFIVESVRSTWVR